MDQYDPMKYLNLRGTHLGDVTAGDATTRGRRQQRRTTGRRVPDDVLLRLRAFEDQNVSGKGY